LKSKLAIIIPTLNEKENIRLLLNKIEAALNPNFAPQNAGQNLASSKFSKKSGVNPDYNNISNAKSGLKDIPWEVIFVDDDSSDDTAEFVRRIGQEDPRVRCLQRIGRRGLASACIEGMLATSAPYLAVMDADLQHDETLLPAMLHALTKEDLDIVIASRYVEEGGVGKWSKKRILISKLATLIGKKILKMDLKDPLSGFFVLKRTFFQSVVYKLTGKGFKILLDLCASSKRKIKFKEIPYEFRKRHSGSSKLDTMVAWEYILLLADKTIGKFIPVRFVMFTLVGCLGALVHLSILGLFFMLLGTSFIASQVIAVLVTMIFNFILDNIFTYRDLKLHGTNFIVGLFLFCLTCSMGAFINIRVAFFIYSNGVVWWFAGLLGAFIGAVWNYSLASTFIWRYKNRIRNGVYEQNK